MKKLLIAAAIAATFTGNLVHAEDVKPDHELSFNLGAVSDYRYRGLSQSRLDPAMQGGADYAHNPSGFYAGTWMSSIKWVKDAGGKGNLEMDIYAGKKGEIVKGVSYDIGVLSYVYPSNGLAVDANTTEVYGQIGYGPAYLKYSQSVTNLFGFDNSKNSGYLDLGANFEVMPGYTLGLHYGHQSVKNNSAVAYDDWKVGVNKEFFGVNVGLAVIGTNANENLYITPEGKFTGKTSVVLSAAKTF
ncbi:hypothetical protein EJG51_010990 [Undibacterium piscinae]|uniref:Uncharacterized protein n=1 Tax=Undibacterium piscinae TaxID=2495591 RepID=A0A6M4A4T8_9BURK|nr:hypothetical protein EJG51_010990 [Undibacterium piscinae]